MTSGAGGARNSFTSLVPLFHVQTRVLSITVLAPAPSVLPMSVDASSLVRMSHGSVAVGAPGVPPRPESLDAGLELGLVSGTLDAISDWTATGEGDAAVVVDGGAVVVSAAGVWQAPTASAMNDKDSGGSGRLRPTVQVRVGIDLPS